MEQGVSASCIHTDKTTWGKWNEFIYWQVVCSDLSNVIEPVTFLHIFSHQVRAGILTERSCNIRKCLVDQWLCSLKQIFSEVGTTDTQIKSLENINFCLCQQLAKYQEGNPSPTCFHPILLSLFLHLRSLYASSTTAQYAITNIYLLTFFYLLCLR